MTTTATLIGASSPCSRWKAIPWRSIRQHVQRLQRRIAQATREGRWGKVKALQWLLTHAFSAKLLAVRRVVHNAGRNTAGVDGVLWRSSGQKWAAAQSLGRRGYRPLPLRRIYIPKKNGKLRPLGIPTLADRAMQALHLLALEPVAETTAAPNSYGFRPKRSAADAGEQCFNALATRHCAQWIFEGDIKACFDQIGHRWLVEHIPMDKPILGKWLAAGFMENGALYPTTAGTPQGGIASPVLANMALDGLEAVAHAAAPRHQKVHVVRYADDFIITGASKELLETRVKPAVVAFLATRGLQLAEEKTRITHIDDGFDFLGFNVRKYAGKLLIKPAMQGVKRFLEAIREVIKTQRAVKTVDLIRQLNRKIRGWANYYRHVVAKKTFAYVDQQVFLAVSAWIKRRHPQKTAAWRHRHYFRAEGLQHWGFHARYRDEQGRPACLDLFRASSLPITRHIKIRAEATPYDPAYHDYFSLRAQSRRVSKRQWRGSLAFA